MSSPTRRRMDLRAIGLAGEARATALAEAEASLDRVVDALFDAELPNVKLAAELAGVSRDTLYARMAVRRAELAEVTP